jgi:membrane protein, antimicrobial resistance system
MSALLDLLKILYEPTAVFERVREKPRFLAPFAGLAVAVIVLGFLQLPYTKAAMTAQFSQMPNLPPEAAQRAMSFAPIGLIVAPIFFAIVLLLNALVLWVLVSVLGGEAKFATMLSVTTYAAIAFVLLSAIGLVVLMTRGPGAITGMADLQPALGLDLLAPDAKGFTLAFLRGVNPFTLYGLFLTATGIAVTHRTTKGTAYTAAVIQLLITLLVTAALSGMRGGS